MRDFCAPAAVFFLQRVAELASEATSHGSDSALSYRAFFNYIGSVNDNAPVDTKTVTEVYQVRAVVASAVAVAVVVPQSRRYVRTVPPQLKTQRSVLQIADLHLFMFMFHSTGEKKSLMQMMRWLFSSVVSIYLLLFFVVLVFFCLFPSRRT